MLKIYTDGSCLGNPGPGGWGVVLADNSSNILLEISGHAEDTTNNRMELTAAIEALRWVQKQQTELEIELYTDSSYVKDGLTKWIKGWKEKNWKTANKQPVKNKELWIELDKLYSDLNVQFHWIKAHVGHELNERADFLAHSSASEKKKLFNESQQLKKILQNSSKASVEKKSTSDRLCFFDLETTGFSADHGHRAIEIGVVEVIDRKITKNTFHTYLNPERSVDEGAQRVHGLSREFLSDKPLFHHVVQPLLKFIEGSIMIAHNANFDESFLNMELKRVGLKPLKNYCLKIEDSLTLARSLYPGKKNSLDALCQRLDISNSHRQYHGALLDSELLAQVYLAMTGGQKKLSFENLSDSNEGKDNLNLSKEIQPATLSEAEKNAHEQWCKNHTKDGEQWLFQELK